MIGLCAGNPNAAFKVLCDCCDSHEHWDEGLGCQRLHTAMSQSCIMQSKPHAARLGVAQNRVVMMTHMHDHGMDLT